MRASVLVPMLGLALAAGHPFASHAQSVAPAGAGRSPIVTGYGGGFVPAYGAPGNQPNYAPNGGRPNFGMSGGGGQAGVGQAPGSAAAAQAEAGTSGQAAAAQSQPVPLQPASTGPGRVYPGQAYPGPNGTAAPGPQPMKGFQDARPGLMQVVPMPASAGLNQAPTSQAVARGPQPGQITGLPLGQANMSGQGSASTPLAGVTASGAGYTTNSYASQGTVPAPVATARAYVAPATPSYASPAPQPLPAAPATLVQPVQSRPPATNSAGPGFTIVAAPPGAPFPNAGYIAGAVPPTGGSPAPQVYAGVPPYQGQPGGPTGAAFLPTMHPHAVGKVRGVKGAHSANASAHRVSRIKPMGTNTDPWMQQ